MSEPREDANCLDCHYKSTCRKAYDKEHNEFGKPYVKCYGYEKGWTDAELKEWFDKHKNE